MTTRTPFNPRKALAECGGLWAARSFRDLYAVKVGVCLDRVALYCVLRGHGFRALDSWRWAGVAAAEVSP